MAEKILDVIIDAQDKASPAFRTVAGQVELFRARTEAATKTLRQYNELIAGGAVALATSFARAAAASADKATEAAEAYRSGNLSLRDLIGSLARAIPLVGDLTRMFDSLQAAALAAFGVDSVASIEAQAAAQNKLNDAWAQGLRIARELASRRAAAESGPEGQANRAFADAMTQIQTATMTEATRAKAVADARALYFRAIDEAQQAADSAAAAARADEERTANEQAARQRAAVESRRRDAIDIQQRIARLRITDESALARFDIESEFEAAADPRRNPGNRTDLGLLFALRQAQLDRLSRSEAARAEADAIRQQMAALQGGSAGPSAVTSAALSRNFRDLAATRAEDTANKQLEEQRRLREEFTRLADRLAVLERVAVL